MAFQPLVNGTAYSWSQITLNILGVPVAGVSAISYNEEQEMTDNYGAGNRPVSRGYGRITTEGSVTLHMEEVEAIQAAVSTGRLQYIREFDVVVAYLPEGGNIVTHTLKNVRFKNNGREISEGDMVVSVEIPMQISHINWK
jgi:hypothetical protein